MAIEDFKHYQKAIGAAHELAFKRSKLEQGRIEEDLACTLSTAVTLWRMEQARLKGCLQVYGQWKKSLESDPCPEDMRIFSDVETAIDLLTEKLKEVEAFIQDTHQS